MFYFKSSLTAGLLCSILSLQVDSRAVPVQRKVSTASKSTTVKAYIASTTSTHATTTSTSTYATITITPSTSTSTSTSSTSTSTSTSTTSSSTSTSTSTSTSSITYTSSSSSTTSIPTSTSLKKGLGFNTNSYLTAFGNSLAWCYNWSNSPAGIIPSGVEFTPMLWGTDATGWSTAAQAAINAGAKHLLAFNEPDLNTQSNISPAAAAASWKMNMEPFYGKAKLISPAITNGGAPMGVEWLKEFVGNCTACHIDGIAMHWYDSATNLGYFTNYISDVHTTFNLPIWLTEFAGYGTETDQETFIKTVVHWLETQPFIDHYAAFGDFAGTFVNQDGTLTPLGLVYKNAL